jgi:hypothetical protein
MKALSTRWVILLIVLALLSGGIRPAAAQSDAPAWSQPVNLSASGGTENPQIVAAADGKVHVFWEDSYANMVYTSGDGRQWDPPTAVELPFFQADTQLLADSNGLIYAFWLTDTNELYYSFASAESAGLESAWSPEVRLNENIIAYKAAVDANNQIHLAYILAFESVNAQAGLYYTQTLSGSQAWSTPVLIYASRYYRTLLPPPGSFTPQTRSGAVLQIDISAAVKDGQTEVFIGWDDSAVKRNFFARSLDGGKTWSAPIGLDTPETLASYQVPDHMHIQATAAGLLLIWNRGGENGENCTQHYQFSTDAGEKWLSEGDLWQEFGACPSDMRFFDDGQGHWVVTAVIQAQVYLLAWNGHQWSDPQSQTDLLSFTNPETLDIVDYGCQTSALLGPFLIMAGCDESGGGDVWATARSLSDVANWFVDRPGWSALQSLDAGSLPINAVTLVSDPAADVFLYWPGQKPDSSPAEWGVQSAELTSGGLNGPYEIQNVPRGIPQGLTTAYLAGFDRLISAWQAGDQGELFSGWGNPQQAVNDTGWTDGQVVNPSAPYGSTPVILETNDGIVHLFFSVPFNETRGIYQTQSADGGETWSDPHLVIGSSAVNCPAFGDFSVAQQDGVHFSALFSCATLPAGIGARDLYAVASADSGQTWSSPELVAEDTVSWSRVLASGEQRFYRLWLVNAEDNARLWFSVSQDNGVSWSSPDNFFSNTADVLKLDARAADSGEVFVGALYQATAQDEARLETLFWNGADWSRLPGLSIPRRSLSSVSAISMQLIGSNALGVAVAGSQQSSLQSAPVSRVVYSQIPVEISAAASIAIAIPTSQPTLTVSTPVNQLEDNPPVSTPQFSHEQSAALPTWAGVIVGGGVALILIVGFYVYVRFIRKREDD